jgi:hypothetical protein
VLAGALLPFVAVFGRFERPKPRAGPAPGAIRQLAGAALVCASLALLALGGIGGDGPLGLRPVVLGAAFLGSLLILGPAIRRGTASA